MKGYKITHRVYQGDDCYIEPTTRVKGTLIEALNYVLDNGKWNNQRVDEFIEIKEVRIRKGKK